MPRNNQGTRNNSNNNNRSSSNRSSRGNRSEGGVAEIARDRPFTAAVTAAAAVGAGVFLWSRRNQISDQISNLSDQFGEWRDTIGSEPKFETESAGDFSGSDDFAAAKPARGAGQKSQQQIAEEALSLKETGTTEARGI